MWPYLRTSLWAVRDDTPDDYIPGGDDDEEESGDDAVIPVE